MKTTVEISDALLAHAKRHAAERGVTLRALIESGLRMVLATPTEKPFVLRDARMDGRGLQDGVDDGGWAAIVERSYEGRGGT